MVPEVLSFSTTRFPTLYFEVFGETSVIDSASFMLFFSTDLIEYSDS